MPLFKGIMLFKSSDQVGGWSEVYNVSAVDIPSAYTALNRIAQVRDDILDPDNTITNLRVSTAPVPAAPPFLRAQRAAQLFPLNYNGTAPNNNEGADLIFCSAMVRFFDATQTVFRNILFRGIPDSWWSGNSDKVGRATLNAWVGKMVAALVAGQAVILHENRAAGIKVGTPINGGFFERLTRRATGRPFGLSRGRR